MAFGFGNTSSLTYTGFAFLAGTNVQQFTGPGWQAASGDITPIGQADGILRTKVVSGRLNQQPIPVPFFFDPASASGGIQPSATTTGTLAMTYQGSENTFSMAAGMTAHKYGDAIDDEVMVGECEFLLIGGEAMDAIYAA